MKKYYLTVNPFTLTNIENQEVIEYSNLDNILDACLKESCEVYVFDFNKLIRVFSNKLVNKGYEHTTMDKLGAKRMLGAIKPMTYLAVATKEDATMLRVRRTTKAQTKFFNASKLFGNATVSDIVSSVGADNEGIGMSLAIKSLKSNGLNGWTLSGNAFKDLVRRCFKKENAKGEDISEYHFKKDWFQPLSKEVHQFIMKSFQGGICHFNKKYAGKELTCGGVEYDANSMYPSVMEKEYLPYGTPVRFEGKYKKDVFKPLYFQEIHIKSLKLKRNGVPCIKRQGQQGYYTNAKNLVLVMNHVDLKLMKMNYKVRGISYHGGYKFRSIKGLFNKYIAYWKAKKKDAERRGDKFGRMIAKLMLNSAYGKFATRTDKKNVYYKKNSQGQIAMYVDLNTTEGNGVYAPVGAYITSYARLRLITVIRKNKRRFIYSDTDSIYLKGNKVAKGLRIHESKFGCWKKEFNWKRMYIVGKKQYVVEKEDGSLKVTCAGMPLEATGKITTFEEFRIGAEFKYDIVEYDEEAIAYTEEHTYVLKDENIF